jgi:hypothetical protein
MSAKPSTQQDCFGLLSDVGTVERRTVTSATAYSNFERYWDLHNQVRAWKRDGDPRCTNLEYQVRDRAVGAERDLRILLDDAVGALNDLRDSGTLKSSIDEAARAFGKGTTIGDLRKGLALAETALSERYPGVDFRAIRMASERLGESVSKIGTQKDALQLHLAVPGGGDRKVALDTRARPGELGRIGQREFFDPRTSALPGVVGAVHVPIYPPFVPDDCHHRQLDVAVDIDRIDAYSSLLGSFANAKQSMYRHVRKVTELGVGRARGEDPITAILIVGAVVAAVLIIAGVTINIGCQQGWWSGDVCNWGWGLIFAGVILGGIVCVASGACSLVLTPLLHIIV